MLNLKNRSIAATATMIATVLTVATAAPVRAETVSAPVSYADLDLSTASGSATLERRIGRAADAICGRGDAMTRIQTAQCRRQAVTAARADAGLIPARRTVLVLAAK